MRWTCCIVLLLNWTTVTASSTKTETRCLVNTADTSTTDIHLNCLDPDDHEMVHVKKAYYGKTAVFSPADFCEFPVPDSVSHCQQSMVDLTAEVGNICNTFSSCKYAANYVDLPRCADQYHGFPYIHVEYECLKRQHNGASIKHIDMSVDRHYEMEGSAYLMLPLEEDYWVQEDYYACYVHKHPDVATAWNIVEAKGLDLEADSNCPYELSISGSLGGASDHFTFCTPEWFNTEEDIRQEFVGSRQVAVEFQRKSGQAKGKLWLAVYASSPNNSNPSLSVDCTHRKLFTSKDLAEMTSGSAFETTADRNPIRTSGETIFYESTPPVAAQPSTDSDSGFPVAIIAGAAAGGLVILVLIIVCIAVAVTHRRRQHKPAAPHEVIQAWDNSEQSSGSSANTVNGKDNKAFLKDKSPQKDKNRNTPSFISPSLSPSPSKSKQASCASSRESLGVDIYAEIPDYCPDQTAPGPYSRHNARSAPNLYATNARRSPVTTRAPITASVSHTTSPVNGKVFDPLNATHSTSALPGPYLYATTDRPRPRAQQTLSPSRSQYSSRHSSSESLSPARPHSEYNNVPMGYATYGGNKRTTQQPQPLQLSVSGSLYAKPKKVKKSVRESFDSPEIFLAQQDALSEAQYVNIQPQVIEEDNGLYGYSSSLPHHF